MFEMMKQVLDARPQPEDTPAHHIINSTNTMYWTVRDARQFSIDLMIATFTREEMAEHLAFISTSGRRKTKKTELP